MKKIICLLVVMGFACTSVQAATFNFGDYASGDNSNGASFSDGSGSIGGLGESGYESYSVTQGGVTVTATGSSVDDSTAFAYMDSYWNARAGLGVCKNLNGNQCGPSSDDNVTYNETLKLVFDSTVSLDSLRLVNGDHYTNFIGDFQIRINENNSLLHTLSLAELPILSDFVGHTFEFISLAGSNPDSREEFYINTLEVSAVPLPAAAWLFGSALLGLFGFSRRKANT